MQTIESLENINCTLADEVKQVRRLLENAKNQTCDTECLRRDSKLQVVQTENVMLKEQLILQKELFKFITDEYNQVIRIKNSMAPNILEATTASSVNASEIPIKQSRSELHHNQTSHQDKFVFPKKSVKPKLVPQVPLLLKNSFTALACPSTDRECNECCSHTDSQIHACTTIPKTHIAEGKGRTEQNTVEKHGQTERKQPTVWKRSQPGGIDKRPEKSKSKQH